MTAGASPRPSVTATGAVAALAVRRAARRGLCAVRPVNLGG
ncbi:hypothetical protein [Planomonospora algeriensis]